MARRIDWERETLNRKARRGLSIKDETEFRKTDFAATLDRARRTTPTAVGETAGTAIDEKTETSPAAIKAKIR